MSADGPSARFVECCDAVMEQNDQVVGVVVEMGEGWGVDLLPRALAETKLGTTSLRESRQPELAYPRAIYQRALINKFTYIPYMYCQLNCSTLFYVLLYLPTLGQQRYLGSKVWFFALRTDYSPSPISISETHFVGCYVSSEEEKSRAFP